MNTPMTHDPNLGLYAVAAAIAVVGALWVGVPASTLAVIGIALMCPLMMLFMMHGMHGGGSGAEPRDRSDDRHPQDR